MTIQEFHIGFDIELDKTLDFEYPYIMPEKKDYWLNKAQERFIKSRAFGNNLFRTSFEESEKRMDDLRIIVVTPSAISTTNTGNNFYTTLPDDYLYLFRHRCNTINSSCEEPQLVAGIQATHDEMNILNKDPFWEPIPEEPLYYLEGNRIVYETDGTFTVQSSLITYIRKYAKMQYGSQYISPIADINCELAEHTHHEILDMAVSMVLENIESQRYQTNLSELTKME